jgi:hypothetical protein
VNDQVRRYIEQAPEAISGSGGHSTTLKVARCLYNGFGLDECQVFAWLKAYNARLTDTWSDRELIHKAKSAATGTYDKPRGWMLSTTVTTVLSYSQSSAMVKETVVKSPQHPKPGVKKQQKCENTTVTTVLSESQRSAYVHARANQPHWEWKTTVVTDQETPLSAEQKAKAHRIAGELVKMHRDGAIKGADDPEAQFYSPVLHTFGGTYASKRSDKKEAPTGPYVPTKEQLVIVPPGLTRKERMKFLQDDLDEAFGE